MSGIRILSESPPPSPHPTVSTKQYNVTEIPKPKDQDTCETNAAKQYV